MLNKCVLLFTLFYFLYTFTKCFCCLFKFILLGQKSFSLGINVTYSKYRQIFIWKNYHSLSYYLNTTVYFLLFSLGITYMHKVCPESIQPGTMKNRDIYWRWYKRQEILYKGQCCLNPCWSGHLGTSHSSPSASSTVQNTLENPLLQSPSAALWYFPEFHWWSEISCLSKVILSWLV